MICSICKEIYYFQTTLDPAEPCPCGQMAWGTPWQWDRWKGMKNWIWYWVGRKAVWVTSYIIMRGYR